MDSQPIIELLVRQGELTALLGSMFARKTTHLRSLCKGRAIFYPRYYQNMEQQLQTHDNDTIEEAIIIEDPRSMLMWDLNIFPIDEISLWGDQSAALLETICKLLERNKAIVVAGFDKDVNGQEPLIITDIKKIASKLIYLRPKCSQCGRPANRTEKVGGNYSQVIQGGESKYEPRCSLHFTPAWKKV